MSKARILVIDDDPEMLALAKYRLSEQDYDVTVVDTGEGALAAAYQQPFEVALTDLQLPDLDGLEVVRRLREIEPATEIIMITGYGSVHGAVDAIKAGAFYFVEKPVKFDELFALIDKALERRQQAAEIEQLRSKLTKPEHYHDIIGGSRAMLNLYEIIDRVAESDANIMIVGESGTGKELIANAIHYKSLRKKKPFVKINCSALPKELIESELFGHTKGAFTGAAGEKTGLIGQANGGSLLLDEIGEMPLELQPKLLRVLQERVYYRLGSEKALDADFRLISATNRNPLDGVSEGHLREDLYYRINTIEIHVPPLRERAEDVQHLAEHFLRVFAEKYRRPVLSISQQVYGRMFEYHWPGNVRELQNVIERAVLLCESDTIDELALPVSKTPVTATVSAPAATAAKFVPIPALPASDSNAALQPQVNIGDLSFEQLGRIIVRKSTDPTADGSQSDLFTRIEGAIVKAAIERSKGNKQAAANLLGVHRPRLYHLLRKHNLHSLIRSVSGSYPEETPADEPWDQDPEKPDESSQFRVHGSQYATGS